MCLCAQLHHPNQMTATFMKSSTLCPGGYTIIPLLQSRTNPRDGSDIFDMFSGNLIRKCKVVDLGVGWGGEQLMFTCQFCNMYSNCSNSKTNKVPYCLCEDEVSADSQYHEVTGTSKRVSRPFSYKVKQGIVNPITHLHLLPETNTLLIYGFLHSSLAWP
jgi:hypothetical protein